MGPLITQGDFMAKPLEDCNVTATLEDGTYTVGNTPGKPSDLFRFHEHCRVVGATPLREGTFAIQEERLTDSRHDNDVTMQIIRSKVDPKRWPPQPTRDQIIADNEAKAKKAEQEAARRNGGYGGGYGRGGYGDNDGGYGGRGGW
jgi:hypothetical protein